jgi:hypothetical protein
MCLVSAIYDQRRDWFPEIIPTPQETAPTFTPVAIPWPPPTVDLAELRKLIDDFRAAVTAAKVEDERNGEPDCLDPEKAKLDDRIRELEKIIAAPPEFVIVTGGKIEPGRYRVIDGKLYRAIE